MICFIVLKPRPNDAFPKYKPQVALAIQSSMRSLMRRVPNLWKSAICHFRLHICLHWLVDHYPIETYGQANYFDRIMIFMRCRSPER